MAVLPDPHHRGLITGSYSSLSRFYYQLAAPGWKFAMDDTTIHHEGWNALKRRGTKGKGSVQQTHTGPGRIIVNAEYY
jgi:hypothetical protein